MSLTGAQAPNQGDVLLVGDIDEIPRIDTLTALRNCAFPPRVTLRTQMYYYSYQWLHRGELWHHPQATYFNGKDTIKPESLRMDKADAELYMTGWHCSSCFRYVPIHYSFPSNIQLETSQSSLWGAKSLFLYFYQDLRHLKGALVGQIHFPVQRIMSIRASQHSSQKQGL